MGPGRDISHESYKLTLFPLSTSPPTYSISDMGFDSLLRTVSSLHLVSASSLLIIVIFSNDAAITTSFHICSSIVSGSDDATSTSKCLPPPLPPPLPTIIIPRVSLFITAAVCQHVFRLTAVRKLPSHLVAQL